jgi:hypothetical protein
MIFMPLPQVLDDLMVQDCIRGDHAPANGHLVGEINRISVHIGNLSTGFSTDEHPCRCISYPERPPEVDKTIDTSRPDITQLKG